jgi:hypothetical protein
MTFSSASFVYSTLFQFSPLCSSGDKPNVLLTDGYDIWFCYFDVAAGEIELAFLF